MSERAMISKLQFGFVDRGRQREPSLPLVAHRSSLITARGFTLLELVMVMTIIVILAAVAVTSYQHIQLKARETILQHDLNEMRKMIDQYSADREKLPTTLDDLVTAGYMHDIPVDPTTGDKDWVVDMGEDTISREGGTGVVDVHSNSAGQGSDGKAYKDY
ncbi:MAG TPA: type II secretion system protein [Blastocatellia bacterium]|nr:type II secretion system protein [Blastocatellia bacterium]